jgi:chromosome segregation ATPase
MRACDHLECELADMTKQVDPYEREASKAAIKALERQLADKRSQINRLINVIKSRDTDKVYSDKKYNELRDEVVATRELSDTLADALASLLSGVKDGWFNEGKWWHTGIEQAEQALAATKGGIDE